MAYERCMSNSSNDCHHDCSDRSTVKLHLPSYRYSLFLNGELTKRRRKCWCDAKMKVTIITQHARASSLVSPYTSHYILHHHKVLYKYLLYIVKIVECFDNCCVVLFFAFFACLRFCTPTVYLYIWI